MTPDRIARYARDLRILASAVMVGGVVTALAHPALVSLLDPEAARNVALALATTLTGATHARLAHRQPWHMLFPSLLINGPLVYLLMRGVHAVVGG